MDYIVVLDIHKEIIFFLILVSLLGKQIQRYFNVSKNKK